MDRHAAVEAVMDRRALEIGVRCVAVHVEVNGVATQGVLLAHVVELDAFDAGLGSLHDHHVTAEAVLGRGIVASHDDVAGEQSDFGALVDRPTGERLDRPQCCVVERAVEL